MRKTLVDIIFYLLFLLSLGLQPSSAWSAEAEADWLQSSYPMLDGSEVRLGQLLGHQPVYIKFWATWCQPCREQMPHLQRVTSEYGDVVQTLSINLGFNDTPEQVRQFMEQQELDFPVILDSEGELSQHLGMVATPYHLLFDSQGQLRYRGHEANRELDSALEAVVESAQQRKVQQEWPSLSLPEELSFTSSARPSDAASRGDDAVLSVVLYTASWCDWYWLESRPHEAALCVDAQRRLNQLQQDYPELTLRVVFNHMWTTEKEVAAYRQRFEAEQRLDIDIDNRLFYRHMITNVPVIGLYRDGEELERFDSEQEFKHLGQQVAKWIAAEDTRQGGL